MKYELGYEFKRDGSWWVVTATTDTFVIATRKGVERKSITADDLMKVMK